MDRSDLWVNVFRKTEELIRRLKRAQLANKKMKFSNRQLTTDMMIK